MPTSINATPSEIDRSKVERYGNRYYPVDDSYDKRVYENSLFNWFRIMATLIAFWAFQAIHWWGVFELGINWTNILMWYSVGIFLYTVLVGAVLLVSGKKANKIKRHHEFLIDKISEKKAQRLEDDLREKQQKEYGERVAAAAAKEEEKEKMNYGIQNDGNDLISNSRV